MKKFVVACVDFDDNLVLEQHSANTWQEAVAKHSKCEDMFPDGVPDDKEDMQQEAFDQDCNVDFLEIS